MPEGSDPSTHDQLSSFSDSVTRPYDELKELKAAAAAVSSNKGLSVIPVQPLFVLMNKTIFFYNRQGKANVFV